MPLNIGIMGLPNSGKSTLFNAITHAHAPTGTHAFSTTDRNIASVNVPDSRLEKLAEMFDPKKVTPTTVEFVDIPGVVKGSSEGAGLGNKFLGFLRQSDALAEVVRCFDDPNVPHPDETIDPVRDMETVRLEFVLADLAVVERRMERTRSAAKSGDKKHVYELSVLEKVQERFNEGIPIREMGLSEEEQAALGELDLLTAKPVFYVANVNEGASPDDERAAAMRKAAPGAQIIAVPAKLEAELAEMDPEDAGVFREEMGLRESALDEVIRTGYQLLDLITFLTAGEPEVRAWTVRRGAKAPEAAGKIHSDIERGFIRAEVTPFPELVQAGSFANARTKGTLRLEGKEYTVHDGDVIYFRFSV
ncbi:MAG TPA: redox-regulated ATPase YchF [Chloroflexota bacterium]|nr:redox-regulated ATPase YchF [Chloroflexota bacterium]